MSIQRRASILLNRLNFIEGRALGVKKEDVQKAYSEHQALRNTVDKQLAVMAKAKKDILAALSGMYALEDKLESNYRDLLRKSSSQQGDAIDPFIEAAARLTGTVGSLEVLTKNIAGAFSNFDTLVKQYQSSKDKVTAGFNETIRNF